MRRVAIGGLGLTTAVGIILLLAIWNTAGRLSAMERMVRKLQNVQSFTYRLSSTHTSKPKAVRHPLIVQRNDSTAWQAPGPSQQHLLGSLYAETKILQIKGVSLDASDRNMTVHIEEKFPVGERGMMINHIAKTYLRTPPIRGNEFYGESPMRMLEIVREGTGEILRELGSKDIGGKQARGYLVSFKAYEPFSTVDSVEVWINPETDLPVQFSFKAENDWQSQLFRVTECQWNIEVDESLFATTAPAGYDDITPPSDEITFQRMVAALKLYAELDGGRYPSGPQFDADAVQKEMLTLAKFIEPPKPEWDTDPRFQAIRDAKAGLDWIERILRNKYLAGYHGDTVRAGDGDKVLLWWTVDADDSHRVFYGDLRTEVITNAQFEALGVKQP